MKHFKYFDNETTYNTERNNNYEEPWVSWTENKGVNYNKKKYEPLTFKILSDGEIGWKIGGGSSSRQIYYSRNDVGVWLGITSTSEGTTIPVVAGDVLRFKGSVFPGSGYDDHSQFTSTCTFAASGNPGSLKYGEVTYGDEPLATGCYYRLFKDCTGLISAPELPTTTLGNYCYYGMFQGCTSLMTAPELPAMTLATNCYSQMFDGCTSLTTAPELPATTLVGSCYQTMFKGCTSLTKAPELPATTLVGSCYSHMFQGCTSLTTAPELPATTLVGYCYYQMFEGCTSLNYVKAMFIELTPTNATTNWLYHVASTGTFVKNASATWTPGGGSSVPTDWTVQTATE